ncbi:MAG: PQQ-binding-like beta-propeller repeat protein [Phycisphaerae bacterium]|nr:PQQ-binding-like beta-propeller repeat protein [Phycisphaerae bacterium]
MDIKKIAGFAVLVGLMSGLAMGADWPGFRNADRTGITAENGLMEKWPQAGPKELWSVSDLGMGYSSASIADGMVYTTGMDRSKEGYLFAYDTKGNFKWKKNYGPEWKGSFPAARTTPVIEENRLYIISGYGLVKCYDAKTGDEKWTVDTLKKFKGNVNRWGLSESVLLYKDKVICSPGGADASIVALDKMTGKTLWTSKGVSEVSAYCAPVIAKHGDMNIVISMLNESFVGIDADNGQLLWKEKNPPRPGGRSGGINPVTPIYQDGCFYITAGYDCGGAMFKIAKDGKSITKVWDDKLLDVHHGGVVLIDGYIYGSNWENNSSGSWICLDFKTGKKMYEEKWLGYKGSIIAANDMLYCWEEKKGNMALVKATPDGFKIISSFTVEKGDKEFWAHPAISDGVLYIRHGDVLMAYDIKK